MGGKSEDLRELIATIPSGSLAAKVRQLMPDIDRRIREEGVRHEHIVAALNEHGGFERPLTLHHFRWILADFRRRRRGARVEEPSAPGAPALASRPVALATSLQSNAGDVPSVTAGIDQRISSKADLRRLRSMNVDLEALAKQAKEE